MKFGPSLDKFVKWFFVCGLSCYPSFAEFLTRKTKKRSFMRYIPTGGLFALIATIGGCAFLATISCGPDIYILISFIFGPILTILVSLMQMVFLSPHFSGICSQINAFERLSRKKFVIDSGAFRRHFIRRACLIFIVLILPILLWLYGRKNHILLEFAVAALRPLMFLTFIHAYFYINILDHLLQCFARHLDMRASTAMVTINVETIINGHNGWADQLRIEINEWKLLHFKLWQISKNINKLFGWTIVAIFLQNFLFAINYMYLVFLALPASSLVFQAQGKLTRMRL